MIRLMVILLSVFSLMSCDKQQAIEQLVTDSTCYKGKLVLKGICNNAVVQVLDDRMPLSFYEESWKDEFTGIVYQKVMGNSNYCGFPADLKENDEFYFRIASPTVGPPNCVNCKAYSPSPQLRQYIQICGAK